MSLVEQSKIKNEDTQKIEDLLMPHFPNVEAYRYNIASIRVRILNDRFKGKSKVERYDMVSPLLDKLPEDILCDITIVLLLDPEEVPQSMMNVEFEHPSPSRL